MRLQFCQAIHSTSAPTVQPNRVSETVPPPENTFEAAHPFPTEVQTHDMAVCCLIRHKQHRLCQKRAASASQDIRPGLDLSLDSQGGRYIGRRRPKVAAAVWNDDRLGHRIGTVPSANTLDVRLKARDPLRHELPM